MAQQQVKVVKNHGAWYMRISETIVEGGVTKRKQPWKWLAGVEDYPKKSEVLPLAQDVVARANRAAKSNNPSVSIVDYFENVYLPAAQGKIAASTLKGYKDSWRCHIKERVHGRVRDFRTVDGENLMDAIEAANGSKLAHATYRHIKVTLSAMFTFAKRKGVYDGVNPFDRGLDPRRQKVRPQAPRL